MDDQSMLLQILGMSGGADVDQETLRDELLARAAENNPQIALLARYLSMRQTGEVEAQIHDAASTESVDETLQAQERDWGEARVRRFDAELRLLRARTHTLAEALGACNDCWGSNPDCRRCRGDGAPGAFVPDVSLFRELVMPAIRRLKRWSAGRSPMYPSARSAESDEPSASNGRDAT